MMAITNRSVAAYVRPRNTRGTVTRCLTRNSAAEVGMLAVEVLVGVVVLLALAFVLSRDSAAIGDEPVASIDGGLRVGARRLDPRRAAARPAGAQRRHPAAALPRRTARLSDVRRRCRTCRG